MMHPTAEVRRRQRARRGWAALLGGAVVVASTLVPVAASPPAAAWPAYPQDCPSGDLRCVDQVIDVMRHRLRAQARACDHDAMFALLYLKVTEHYRQAAAQPGFFDDPAWVNRLGVVFARRYFEAVDDWHAGRGGVAPAWAVALDRAEDREVTGNGDLVLGINAHVNHDLAFAVLEVGMTDRYGRSHKADFDRVNDVLRAAYRPALEELAARFDPTVDDADVPGLAADQEVLLQAVFTWREQSWRAAEAMAAEEALLPTDGGGAAVTAGALAEALAYATSTSSTPAQTEARRAHCDVNAWPPPPGSSA